MYFLHYEHGKGFDESFVSLAIAGGACAEEERQWDVHKRFRPIISPSFKSKVLRADAVFATQGPAGVCFHKRNGVLTCLGVRPC